MIDIKGNMVTDYVKNNPDAPTMTIAKMLHDDHPELFGSIDLARTAVRYRRGNRGDASRKQAKQSFGTMFRENGKSGFVAPPSKQIIPDDATYSDVVKWLVLSDAHIPYHDKDALEIAVNFGIDNGCNAVYLNGDMADNYSWSKHFKYPVHESPTDDILALKNVLAQLAGLFELRVYKIGNHDERWDKYLADNAPRLSEFESMKFEHHSGILEHGFKIAESQQLVFLGKAPVLHGHELGRNTYSPVNAAKGAFNRVKDTVIVGHHHRSSNHLEKMGIEGRLIVTRSLGCLCQLKASYQRVTNWNHGFATIEVKKNGDYDFSNYIITHDREVFRL